MTPKRFGLVRAIFKKCEWWDLKPPVLEDLTHESLNETGKIFIFFINDTHVEELARYWT